MKTKRLITMVMTTVTLVAMPLSATVAEELQDTTMVSGLIVNGKPATPAQKAVAKEMVKQGAKMGTKAARMAVAAVTNPQEAEKMGKELEAMGEEMERMGDSLETLSEDTTFFYEGEDSTAVVLGDEGVDDFFGLSGNLDLNSWWGKLFGGSIGIFGAIIAIFFAILAIVLVFLVLTAPLWVLALIIWLVYRSGRQREETIRRAVENGQPVPPSIYDAPKGADVILWRKGMQQVAWGIGLLIAALVLSSRLIAAIGLVLGCLGGSKLYMAKREQERHTQEQPPASEPTQGKEPASPKEDYNKSEND